MSIKDDDPNKKSLTERLARNEAFWTGGPAERPLLALAVNITFPTVAFSSYKLEHGRIRPDMIDPEQFLSDWDRSYERTEEREEDLFMVASPFAGVPWMEAIAGCEIQASPTSGSIWATHPDPSWPSLERVGFDPHNPWLLKLVECSKVLHDHAAGRYPVGNPILRGVSDIAAALLGPQRMVLEFYDHPQQLQRLLARCAEIWQGVGELLIETFGRFYGGQCPGRRRVWTKGTCFLYQDDAVALLSPTFYQEYIVPVEHEVLRSYDRAMIHTHSATLPLMLAGLLSLDSLAAVEVLLDPTGPTVSQLLETFQCLQKHKGLLICGEMTMEDIQLLVSNLSPQGLALLPKVNTEAEADLLFERIQALWLE